MKLTRARRIWWALMYDDLTPVLRVAQWALPGIVLLLTLVMWALWKLWG